MATLGRRAHVLARGPGWVLIARSFASLHTLIIMYLHMATAQTSRAGAEMPYLEMTASFTSSFRRFREACTNGLITHRSYMPSQMTQWAPFGKWAHPCQVKLTMPLRFVHRLPMAHAQDAGTCSTSALRTPLLTLLIVPSPPMALGTQSPRPLGVTILHQHLPPTERCSSCAVQRTSIEQVQIL